MVLSADALISERMYPPLALLEQSSLVLHLMRERQRFGAMPEEETNR